MPDWYKSVKLVGEYAGTLIPVGVDENGYLIAVMKGTDGTTLQTVKLDVDGTLLAKLVGGIVDVGTITTVEDKDRNVKGYDGAAYKPIAVDADGIMLARLKGFDGSQLRDVLVDADGQIITVLRGQSGNYVFVDPNGYLASILKGTEADGTLRDVLVDDEGRIVGVFKGRYTNPFDLVLDLPFDEGSGSVAYDQSLYGNDGTINGATWTRGRYGYALEFDGEDDYVEIPNTEILNLPAFAVSVWVKFPTLPTGWWTNKILFQANTVSPFQGFWIDVRPDDYRFRFHLADSSNAYDL
ncbi:MAG: hypothetical protein JRC53_04520, partial [Deltaproteobacteria bacterium]|nr:hypothetical protein [Deltaproteobacteria bacterium]